MRAFFSLETDKVRAASKFDGKVFCGHAHGLVERVAAAGHQDGLGRPVPAREDGVGPLQKSDLQEGKVRKHVVF